MSKRQVAHVQDHDATTAVADDEWIRVAEVGESVSPSECHEENMRKALALARAALDAAEAILLLYRAKHVQARAERAAERQMEPASDCALKCSEPW